jgi:hypothetical protein
MLRWSRAVGRPPGEGVDFVREQTRRSRHYHRPTVPIPVRVSAAASLGLLWVLSTGAGAPRTFPAARGPHPPRGMAPLASLPCPPGTLPDGSICVRVSNDENAPVAESVARAHPDRAGDGDLYDQIPRRPDRPADYAAYRYPVACEDCVVSGYDLDRPDEQQRRVRHRTQVGHGAMDLSAHRGAAVTLVGLEHQQGPAVLIFVGPLFGTTVVTLHHVREGGELREYLVFLGHLDAAAPGLPEHSDAPLREGRLLGFVGDSGSPGLVHLHLEVRRVRNGVDANKLAPAALVDNANTIVCDPRNVLPLK